MTKVIPIAGRPAGTRVQKIDPGARKNNRAISPHPERVQRIRAWHIERATSDNRPVAMLAIHITERGDLHSDAIGVEPEHARVMAGELLMLAEQLKALAATARPLLTVVITPERQAATARTNRAFTLLEQASEDACPTMGRA